MLDALKFVQKGVARREIVPGLSHFRIVDGRVTGFNGSYALSSPVDIGFNVAPAAGLFIKALNACEDVITLKMQDEHGLLVRSGDFRTIVPCVPLKDVPITEPEGDVVSPHESILHALEALRPFVGVDASRPWATGILLSNQSAFATNNIIVAEYWLGTPFPRVVNVPSSVVDEVIKVSEELSHLQISDNSITFHYSNGRWIRSQLLNLDWPNILAVLDKAWEGAKLIPPPAGMLEACVKLNQFTDKKLGGHTHFIHNEHGGAVCTHKDESTRGSATVTLPNVPEQGAYHTEYLIDILDVADFVDFGRYPAPVPFSGSSLRGAMVGLNV